MMSRLISQNAYGRLEIEEDWVEMSEDSEVLRGRNCLKRHKDLVCNSFWEFVKMKECTNLVCDGNTSNALTMTNTFA